MNHRDHPWLMLMLTVAFGSATGAAFGFLLLRADLDMPLVLAQMVLGMVATSAAAFGAGKMMEMPEGLIWPRLWPSAIYGALVGLCTYFVWWSFDPPGDFVSAGMFAGLFGSIPVATSYGLAGGSSKPLGLVEFVNIFIGLAAGGFFGLMITGEEGDPDMAWGFMGLLALLPLLAGGRHNLLDAMMSSAKSDE